MNLGWGSRAGQRLPCSGSQQKTGLRIFTKRPWGPSAGLTCLRPGKPPRRLWMPSSAFRVTRYVVSNRSPRGAERSRRAAHSRQYPCWLRGIRRCTVRLCGEIGAMGRAPSGDPPPHGIPIAQSGHRTPVLARSPWFSHSRSGAGRQGPGDFSWSTRSGSGARGTAPGGCIATSYLLGQGGCQGVRPGALDADVRVEPLATRADTPPPAPGS